MPWTKGESGNVRGRPRTSVNTLTARQKKMLKDQLLKKAARGNLDAIKLLMNYVYGPPRTVTPAPEPRRPEPPLDLTSLTSDEVAIFSELVRKAYGQSSEVDWGRIDLLMRSHGRHSALTTHTDVDDDGQDDGEE